MERNERRIEQNINQLATHYSNMELERSNCMEADYFDLQKRRELMEKGGLKQQSRRGVSGGGGGAGYHNATSQLQEIDLDKTLCAALLFILICSLC